jgi:hypothetical protein
MLLRVMQASPALAGITAALLAATAGAGSASPAAPGQPGPAPGWPGSAASSRLALPRPGEVVLTGPAVDGSRPRVIVPAAHAGSAGGMVQTAFSCDETSAAGPARRFGVGQFRSGRAHLGDWAVLAGGRAARLLTASSALVPPRPASAMHTLTVTGTNLAGRPDAGGIAWVFNTDACSTSVGSGGNAVYFQHGSAAFSVPAGHYLAIGEFITGTRARRAVRLDVLPQVTVTGDTTVHTAARSASSHVTVVTQRPATPQNVTFTLIRTGQTGQAKSALSFFAFAYGGMPVWVSPVSRRPAAGGLAAFTSATLTSPPGPGVPYAYNLAFAGPRGVIPPQRFAVTDARLAAVTERYHQDRETPGVYAVLGGLLAEGGEFAEFLPVHLPGRQIQYFTPGRAAAWQLAYDGYSGANAALAGGQVDAVRSFPPGTHTESWNAYPLHPAPNVDLTGTADPQPMLPEASRAANTLVVDVTPFSDSVPGHTGWGFEGGPGQVNGSYQIDQNGRQVAGGRIPPGQAPDFTATARLSPHPSVIRLTVTASRPATAFPLSPASHDVWTWRSAPRPGAIVPWPWFCGITQQGAYVRRCAVQPLLTLGYQVGRLALNGTAPPGRQVLSIQAGHLQLAAQPRITRISVAVSFNSGRTWHAATTTRTSARTFRAVFTAPPGAAVTLRVTATDAGGGALTETIDNGYRIG